MNVEDGFLRAIIDHSYDDTPRLVYADWLEEQGDLRGEFLRLQHELARLPVDDPRYAELAVREQVLLLLEPFDPVWVDRVRRYTTPPPCRDIAKLVPELAPFARTTTRLHPHRMAGERDALDSKIGGHFLWPAQEAWPMCPEHQVPYVPVLQLRQCDVPEVRFYPGTDLFQLLWCPFLDENYEPSRPTVFWRKASSITQPLPSIPQLSDLLIEEDDDEVSELVPYPCSLYPERVVEYPTFDEFYALAGRSRRDDIRRQIAALDMVSGRDLRERFESESGPDSPGSLYFYELSKCPGTKVGGGLSFGPSERRFEHLVTLSSWEFDWASFRRWMPLEDQRLLAGGHPITEGRLQQVRITPLQQATGMTFGRTQRLHLHVCREGANWPIHFGIYQ